VSATETAPTCDSATLQPNNHKAQQCKWAFSVGESAQQTAAPDPLPQLLIDCAQDCHLNFPSFFTHSKTPLFFFFSFLLSVLPTSSLKLSHSVCFQFSSQQAVSIELLHAMVLAPQCVIKVCAFGFAEWVPTSASSM